MRVARTTATTMITNRPLRDWVAARNAPAFRRGLTGVGCRLDGDRPRLCPGTSRSGCSSLGLAMTNSSRVRRMTSSVDRRSGSAVGGSMTPRSAWTLMLPIAGPASTETAPAPFSFAEARSRQRSQRPSADAGRKRPHRLQRRRAVGGRLLGGDRRVVVEVVVPASSEVTAAVPPVKSPCSPVSILRRSRYTGALRIRAGQPARLCKLSTKLPAITTLVDISTGARTAGASESTHPRARSPVHVGCVKEEIVPSARLEGT